MRWAIGAVAVLTAALCWAPAHGQGNLLKMTCQGRQFIFGEQPLTRELRSMVLELAPAMRKARVSLPFIDMLRIVKISDTEVRFASPEHPELERSATIQGTLERESGKLVLFDGGEGATDPMGKVDWRVEAVCTRFEPRVVRPSPQPSEGFPDTILPDRIPAAPPSQQIP